jgi:hypothetical protein
LILCIDNSSAIDALDDPSTEHQHARQATQEATTLSLAGWTINTTWTPSHVNIPGNEAADQAAKHGAIDTSITCPHAITTKTWMKAECKRLFYKAWKAESPDSQPSMKFPTNFISYKWTETRTLAGYSVEGVLQIVADTNHPHNANSAIRMQVLNIT